MSDEFSLSASGRDALDAENSYDRLPYAAMSFPNQNPARNGAIGRIYGMQPASPARCRMLELGCGQGFTLLALAQLYPESEFLGIDQSAAHIEQARSLAEAAGLTNIRFETRSILEVSREHDGDFDYISCHGVFSWVPDDVKHQILEICGTQLREMGIAYVSYNVLPGWSHLKAVREMLIYHTARYDDPIEKYEKAKAFIALLRDNAPNGSFGWTARFLHYAASVIQQATPSYFVHEFLEDRNDPMYFHEFMAMAGPHGLQFVSEAHFSQSLIGSLGPHARQAIEFLRRSPEDAEQYIDFVRHTQFRASLLCRKEVTLQRRLTNVPLKEFVFAASPRTSSPSIKLETGATERFSFPDGATFDSNEAFTKAILLLFSTKPNIFLGLAALYDGAISLLKSNGIPIAAHSEAQGIQTASNVVSRLLASGLVDVSLPEVGAIVPVPGVPKQPFAPPLARRQAERCLPVLRADLSSAPVRAEVAALLALCDGSRNQNDLFRAYKDLIQEGRLASPAPRKPHQPADYKTAFVEILREMGNSMIFWQPLVPSATVQNAAPGPR